VAGRSRLNRLVEADGVSARAEVAWRRIGAVAEQASALCYVTVPATRGVGAYQNKD
jgi:hypothetical protein